MSDYIVLDHGSSEMRGISVIQVCHIVEIIKLTNNPNTNSIGL